MYILNGIRQQEQPTLDLPIHQGQNEPIKILKCLILITEFRNKSNEERKKNLVCVK